MTSRRSFFTVDVEDWYNVMEERGQPPVCEWGALPSIVEKNLRLLLDLLDESGAKATFFFLGYLAKRFPHLVIEVQSRGHEAASHGMYHKPVYEMTRDEFIADITTSRDILDNICGEATYSYRSPGFSLTNKTPWFFGALAEAGYRCDSSMFPVKRDYGGYRTDTLLPHMLCSEQGDICEFPISVAPFLNKEFCFFGGGYLRFFPSRLIMNRHSYLQSRNIPTLFYIHPRELDPGHPRITMNPVNRFKTYVNLPSVIPKIQTILSRGEFVTLKEHYEEMTKDFI